MEAYLVSHNGLGDNLFMVGALNYLLQFYNKIYFLCKNKYYENVKLFFIDTPNIICLPFDDIDEFNSITKIINQVYNNINIDIFICGVCHTCYLKSKINNPLFLENIVPNKNYKIDYDTINTNNYNFIENFYKDAKLNLTIFYDYFTLPSTNESIYLYNCVKQYRNIIFIQLSSSCGKKLNITNLLKKYLHDEKTILICNDKNLYEHDNNSEHIKQKYNTCNKFILNHIVNYVDVIKNSSEIYIIDSCFTGIILPFIKQKLLKANIVRIISRNLVDYVNI